MSSSTLHADQVAGAELDQTLEFARSLPQGSPIAVLLQNVVEAMARGVDVTYLESDTELTPNQAADLLKVSRPYLLKIMDRGLLAYRKVGTNRRIAMADLIDYVDRHERANAHVNELLGTREHRLAAIKDAAAPLSNEDEAALAALIHAETP